MRKKFIFTDNPEKYIWPNVDNQAKLNKNRKLSELFFF